MECDHCGREFNSEQALNSHIGQAHPEETKTTVECASCGQKLKRRKKRVERFNRQFCDEECKGAYYSTITGEDSSQWKGGKVEIECANCGVVFNVFKFRQKDAKYCSSQCYGESISGRDHQDWKGGVEKYGGQWNKKRKEALERDSHQCVICNMTQEEHNRKYGRSLEVHHIKPLHTFKQNGEVDYEKAHKLDNLITMCKSCHNEWEGIPVLPENVR